MIRPFGYCADISRTYHCGPGKPSARQRDMYRIAHEEILHNTALLKAGVTLYEIAPKAWKVPAQYQENCYPFIAHGVGLCDEWPNCYTPDVLATQD
ncbi:MAG: hypothetical protein CMM46_10170 [Rhodospirillaceae bacterium]|nr:hypothetical protein [Rhodospirillaceae bacterium]